MYIDVHRVGIGSDDREREKEDEEEELISIHDSSENR